MKRNRGIEARSRTRKGEEKRRKARNSVDRRQKMVDVETAPRKNEEDKKKIEH